MNAQQLSKRLEKVASFVPTGSIVADIGSDHAYLPCNLVHNKIAKIVIAGEVVKGPFDAAVRQVREEGLTHKISVRLADGLDAIDESDKVDTITISGMGGPLIVSILEKKPNALKNVTRLILQPNIHAKVIREWAIQNNWSLLDEVILEEDGKIYEVLVLQRGEMKLTDEEILLGKYLLNEKSEVFVKKWKKEIDNWKGVLASLDQAEQNSEIETKRGELIRLIALVEGAIGNEKS